MAKVCKECQKLKNAFIDAKSNPHGKLRQTYDIMRELYDHKKLILYMSDCSFKNWWAEISLEEQYTYNIYLRCRKCKKIYHFGVCIRGTPIYRILNEKPGKMKFKCMCLRDGKKFYNGI